MEMVEIQRLKYHTFKIDSEKKGEFVIGDSRQRGWGKGGGGIH